MKKLIPLFLAVAAFASSCKKDNETRGGNFKGAETTLYGGKAWTNIQLDNNGNPQSFSININDAALNSLPVGTGEEGHDPANDFELHLASVAAPVVFDHIGLDWNPNGHEPDGIYTKPHFDFHFYMISEAEQAAIPPYEVDSSKFLNYPAAGYMPATYVPTSGGVPQMGTHWVDVTSPELDPVHPQPFTQTFIYGSYDGKVTFFEPMITLDFIKNNTTFERTIPQPAKFAKAGYYPTRIRISKHDGVTEIILDQLLYRQAS
jgi:hypothetical protein